MIYEQVDYLISVYVIETSEGSTQAEIKSQGFIGSIGHIFHKHKLPVSGYLVAWQYYMNTGNVCTNTSYAAIIRRDGNKYTMIARTLLTPEDSTNAGVRFQFIQNKVIRVQKDDIIAALTSKGEILPCDQLVSINPSQGSDTLTADLGNGFKINETRTFPSTTRQADPALKAFVSGV